ncbi:MAG: hypothetical protein HeimC3_52810 [Candidatus Heimdallarchaeota archaeon LC_3]|nr:MAG: hypothetical protein HeimC3_52810 [Candidatus Heimdallarchaeota archaeon LC_3]
MKLKYSLVSLSKEFDPILFKGIIDIAYTFFHKYLKDSEYFSSTKTIDEINEFLSKYQGTYQPGGQSVVFTLKFYNFGSQYPSMLKIYDKIAPLQLINHILSVEFFNEEFYNGIEIKNKIYKITLPKNLVVSSCPDINSALLIQEFSEGPIPDSLVPLSSICKVIGKSGYVIDFFSKNWRILKNLDIQSMNLSYIDILFSNKVFDINRMNKLKKQLLNTSITVTDDI